MELTQSLAQWCDKNSISYFLSELTESTNDQAKASLTTMTEDMKVYLTEQQTKGRGRGQNEWSTPGKNKSLLFSWIYKLNSPPQAVTSPIIGLSLFRAVQKSWPQLEWSIKPPNDLLLKGKKVAGLLIEAIQQGDQSFLIIGLGFNILNHPEHLPEATHLNSSNGLKGELQLSEMIDFYSHLHRNFSSSLKFIVNPQMNSDFCNELASATGAKVVTPNGDLVYENHTQSWKEL